MLLKVSSLVLRVLTTQLPARGVNHVIPLRSLALDAMLLMSRRVGHLISRTGLLVPRLSVRVPPFPIDVAASLSALPRCECAHARWVSAELSTHSGGLVVAFATNDILSSWCLVKIATNDSLSSASLG